MKPRLTIEQLRTEAAQFAEIESTYNEPTLYGVTDGKAVDTYLEHKFTAYFAESYSYQPGDSASGIDLPDLEVDIKVTSIKQPQSSCPFKSAEQKVFGLGYHLLVFVYEKYDDPNNNSGRLDMKHVIFVDKSRTADFQMTQCIHDILNRDGNKDDIIAFFEDKNLPVDEIKANEIADKIFESPPLEGYLTISNANQWRLQYKRAIQRAGSISGIFRVR